LPPPVSPALFVAEFSRANVSQLFDIEKGSRRMTVGLITR
jgi:hypothetical protein